jgi:hypothetical protein
MRTATIQRVVAVRERLDPPRRGLVVGEHDGRRLARDPRRIAAYARAAV